MNTINVTQAWILVLKPNHLSSLKQYVCRLTGNRQDAHDLVQDVLVRAVERLTTGIYEEDGKLGGWTRRMAHNLYIDRVKGKAVAAQKQNFVTPLVGSHAERQENYVLLREVERKLATIPPSLRESLTIVAMLDNYTDAAQTLGKPRGTVARQTSEARTMLRNLCTATAG
jgi:RNA polymerase sigma factor (sigma-70 family)